MLEIRNLRFAYRERTVLRNVSFVVSPGEVVSIVGANGAGKTTLLKVLSTLAMPDGGNVIFDGHDAFSDQLKYRRSLGYLPETPALYEDMNVREYLQYRASIKGEMDKRIRRRVEEASEMCRVRDFIKTPIRKLSWGMKKRVQLADAMLLRPRVLLLDDFLAGLDRNMREAAGEILHTVAAFSSVIVTGHDLEDMAAWTTRFLILRDGVIEAEVPTAGAEIPALKTRIDALIRGNLK